MINRKYLAVAILLAIPIQCYVLVFITFSWCGLSECDFRGLWSQPSFSGTAFTLAVGELALCIPLVAVRWHPSTRVRVWTAVVVAVAAFVATFLWVTSLGPYNWATP